ncbi:polysaccharide biosynthesis tyrosine autokinase [candidate division KSB1 bacterium]|nr:polysaccharide biosynthesis tyrosine autokinase [candidate division KSB1 bacterium]
MEKISTSEREWGLQDYLSLAIRRKWIILFVFVLIFIPALAYFMTRPPVYRASSSFIIESIGNSDFNMSEFFFESDSRPFGFYMILLNSNQYRSRLEEIALKDSVLQAQPGFSEQLGSVIGSLELTETDYDRLCSLSLRANHPVIVYRLAEIAINEFKRRCQEIELEESRNIVSYVNKQIEQARISLAQAERELQEFKRETRMTNLEQADGGILARLADIEAQLEEVQTQRRLAEANLHSYKTRINEFRTSVSLPVLNAGDESQEIKKLRADVAELEAKKEQYQNSSSRALLARLEAQIRDKKVELRNAILASTSRVSAEDVAHEENSKDVFSEKIVMEELDLFSLKNREAYLQGLIEKYRQDHPNLLEHTIKLAELQRSKQVNESLYSFLVEKEEEAKISAATGTGGIRIVDEPSIPQHPISNNMRRNLAVSVLLALGLGFGLAFAIDFFDNSIYTADDLKRLGEVSLLGSIPYMKKRESRDIVVQKLRQDGKVNNKDLYVFEDRMNGYKDKVISLIRAKEPVVDSYRHVRTNLQFSNVDSSLKNILVSSSIPGEGKTLTVANLGISFAELGKRILIVDCDLRRSHQHILFNIRKSPGLSDYLARDISIEKILYLTHVPNLYVIPAGTTPPNPAEMLASNKMSELIKKLEQNFDFIIYDSPPVIAVTDPILLSRRVGNVVMVVRFGKTNRHLVSDSLKRFANVNSQLVGIVLNGMQKAKGYGYYKYDYAYYQSAYYGDGVKAKKKLSLVN